MLMLMQMLMQMHKDTTKHAAGPQAVGACEKHADHRACSAGQQEAAGASMPWPASYQGMLNSACCGLDFHCPHQPGLCSAAPCKPMRQELGMPTTSIILLK